MPNRDSISAFIDRWSKAEAKERSNYASFLIELCTEIGVPPPEPAGRDTAQNAYVFERAVTFHHRGTDKTTTGYIDLYKRGCFVLEAFRNPAPRRVAAGRLHRREPSVLGHEADAG